MIPKQLDSRFCLLLLLGLMKMIGSLCAAPGNLTRAQWFTIQHINMTHPKCDDAMRVVNGYTGRCKNQNTFLNTTFPNVVNVCLTPAIKCITSKSQNCHKSSVKVNLTYCNLTTPGTVQTCKYAQTEAEMFYIVACDNRSALDPPIYPVVPVHLDATVMLLTQDLVPTLNSQASQSRSLLRHVFDTVWSFGHSLLQRLFPSST
uniref:Eosinophil cationic protein n=1 Tax=Carlito syrichta TaxID=1868482 RepID=W0UV54_CARSF|nr:TPA: ribonuclease A F2 [Carlito syrichta]